MNWIGLRREKTNASTVYTQTSRKFREIFFQVGYGNYFVHIRGRWLCICALIMCCCNSIARLTNATQIQFMCAICALNWDNVFTWLINHKTHASNINRFEAAATRSHAHTLNGLQSIAHASYCTPYDTVLIKKQRHRINAAMLRDRFQ